MQIVEPELDLVPELAQEAPNITQSKFFSPAFNAAIFDGPLRIYFAQYQEEEALNVYFRLQEHFKFEQKRLKGFLKEKGNHVFVLLYPTSDIFSRSFAAEKKDNRIAGDRLGQDVIVGVNGVVDEKDYELIFDEMNEVFNPLSN